MTPAQLARLQAARRLHNSATVQIVLDEYHALAPTLLRIGQVEAMEREIDRLKAALAAQMDATQAEVAKADAALERAKEVRTRLESGKATAESRALRAENALQQALSDLADVITKMAELKASQITNANERLAVAERKIADQAAQIKALTTIRQQRSKGAECEKAGCTDGQYARGLCIRHYQQERRAQASGICPSCGLIRAVGRSGRCRACYLRVVTERGRDAGRCAHV